MLIRYKCRLLYLIEMYDCDFSSGLCGWRSESNYWSWTAESNGNPGQGTGPTEDGDNDPNGKKGPYLICGCSLTYYPLPH